MVTLDGITCIGSRRIVADDTDTVDGGGGGGRAAGGAGARYFLTTGDTRLAPDVDVGVDVGGGGARYLTGLGGNAGFCSRVISDVIISPQHAASFFCHTHNFTYLSDAPEYIQSNAGGCRPTEIYGSKGRSSRKMNIFMDARSA